MTYRKTTSFLHFSYYIFFSTALLLCAVVQQNNQVHAQSIPTIKVEKNKKKVDKPKVRKQPKKVKDSYKRPKSKRKAEKSRDQYNRPPSKRVRFNNSPAKESRLSTPSAEEGQQIQKLSLWQRIFNRDKPTRYGGKTRRNPTEQPNGTQQKGNIKQAPPAQIDKQYGYKAQHMSFYGGSGKVLKPERQDKKTQSNSAKLQQAGLYKKKKSNRHEQMSNDVHQYGGNIKQAPPAQVDKQFGYKAQHMSFYSGNRKVLKPDREDKRLIGISSNMQQAGLYKVRKEKDQAASYTTYQGNLKLPTLKARTRNFEKLSAKVHQYDGDIRYRKPGKDMHPSVFYLKSKTKNSYEQKEKYRRWRLILTHFFDKQEQPKHLKEKKRKPRYDKDESEIWYY